MSDVVAKVPKFTTDDPEDEYPPIDEIASTAHCSSMAHYREMYHESITNPTEFWRKIASNLYWHENDDSSETLTYNIDVRKGPVFVKFMEKAKLNLSYNCLDRHVKEGRGDKVAFYWEGNEPADSKTYTYKQMLDLVVAMAKVLRGKGVKRGDRVAIYLPMIAELPAAMLACARIGAVHSVVFGGFSAPSLASRILDAQCSVVITADAFTRGPKVVNLKNIADDAINEASNKGHSVTACIVVKHINRVTLPKGATIPSFTRNDAIDVNLTEAISTFDGESGEVEWMSAEDNLFMLYTSGSTGKPKGVVHTQAGYQIYAYTTSKYTFDLHPDTDVYWCTADCGWITGHTYIVYGPMANGVTSVLFEGTPIHPTPSRCWEVIAKYKVTKFYTAPTAIRSLMAFRDEFVTQHDRSSLKVLGTVGEPINPAAWLWYHRVVGNQKCSVVDTYWQTETGGHTLTPLPGATMTKPGSATYPFFGIEPAILDDQGREIEGPGEGNLCFKRAWPGMMRTVYGDHQRFERTYFSSFPGYYFTGDGARRDDDGMYWVTGRVDDLMNVSGHLLSTAEIESALVAHKSVAEAAVVAAPDDIKGQVPYAFVTLVTGVKMTPELVAELKNAVRAAIGPLATPAYIQLAPGLPKTRSGKITRRILRKVAEGNVEADLGDVSTLADETVIEQLWAGRTLSSG